MKEQLQKEALKYYMGDMKVDAYDKFIKFIVSVTVDKMKQACLDCVPDVPPYPVDKVDNEEINIRNTIMHESAQMGFNACREEIIRKIKEI